MEKLVYNYIIISNNRINRRLWSILPTLHLQLLGDLDFLGFKSCKSCFCVLGCHNKSVYPVGVTTRKLVNDIPHPIPHKDASPYRQ